jgi:hypothetical protein
VATDNCFEAVMDNFLSKYKRKLEKAGNLIAAEQSHH